jgi:O-antigen ligase/polysaccharide polymerase Wzy-like membrane protein
MSERMDPALAGVGTVLIVLSAMVRAVVTIDPMPVWSMDPLTMWVPQTGIGPTALLGLDLLGMLGAAALLFAMRSRVRMVPVLLLLVGLVAIVIHSLARPVHAEVGMPWAFALAGGFALAHLPRASMWRTVALASILAIAVMLVGKGIVQVYIEHPATVANYEATRETFLDSQGWAPDSAMARNYERRLYQPEASGWFGLSNVFGSLMASMTLAFVTIAWLTLRARINKQRRSGSLKRVLQRWSDSLRRVFEDRRILVILLLAAGLCIAGLFLSASKGAAGAGIVGAVALVAAILFQRAATRNQRAATVRESVPKTDKTPSNSEQLSGEKHNTHRLETGPTMLIRLIVAAVPVVVLLGVVARGLIGERINELSILFRWFYMQGATRIFLDSPILGVGPAGFKDAYLIAKPPISPEEVTSAHNLLFDWLATLGVFSFGWVLLFALAARQIGVMLTSTTPPPSPETRSWDERTAILASAGILAAVIGVSAFVERLLLTPEMGIVRAAGLLGGLAVAGAIVRAARAQPRAVELGAVGAALVLLAHLQIEVTGVWAGAAPIAAALIGLACAPPAETPKPGRGCPGLVGAGSLVAVGIIVASTSGQTLMRWQLEMNKATAAITPIARAVTTLENSQPGTLLFDEGVREIAALAGEQPARTGDQLAGQISRARIAAANAAVPHLIRAVEIRPEHGPTRSAAVRTLVRMAHASTGPVQTELVDQAIVLAAEGTEAAPDRSGSWRLLANTLEAGLGAELGSGQLGQAYAALVRAAELDPYGLGVSLKLVDLAGRLGRTEDRRDWARRALKINSDLGLDPLRQLTDTERANLERLVKDG